MNTKYRYERNTVISSGDNVYSITHFIVSWSIKHLMKQWKLFPISSDIDILILVKSNRKMLYAVKIYLMIIV
ncbi:CHD1 helical C-terminal domain containing protein [Dirofilaria immitis]